MKAYRVKTRAVFAEALTKDNADDLAEMCNGQKVEEVDALDPSKTYVGINVPTRMGTKRLTEGNYLVEVAYGRYEVQSAEYFEGVFEEA